MIKILEKKYHEWQQKAREKYLSGYYPGHNRMPNFIVRGLYWIGYFIGDFIPLILNLINGIYWTIKQLVAFVVGLLIEASISIVLLGSIVFSISHSIERLRQAGATGGLEYVGVLMFEVIFIGSAATLTGILMNKKKPSGFIEWVGLILILLGFLVGLGFVWWSNVNGMAPTWEGFIIGSLVPVLVLIGEGVLAYRYLSESEKDDQTQLLEFIQRNGVSAKDALKAIGTYIANQKSTTNNNMVEHHGVGGSHTTTATNSTDTVLGVVPNTTTKSEAVEGGDGGIATKQTNASTETADHTATDPAEDTASTDRSTTADSSVATNNSTATETVEEKTDSTTNHSTDTETVEEKTDSTTDYSTDSTDSSTDTDKKHSTNTKANRSTKVVDMMERRKNKKELDPETVVAIFLAEGSNTEIGKRFGVSAETVRRIKLGIRHSDITAPYRNGKAKTKP